MSGPCESPDDGRTGVVKPTVGSVVEPLESDRQLGDLSQPKQARGDLAHLHRLVGLEPPEFDRTDVAVIGGVDPEVSLRRWRAMGFPEVPDGEASFSRTDIEMVEALTGVLDMGFIDEDDILTLARLVGASFSRITAAQMAVVAEALEAVPQEGTDTSRREQLANLVRTADDEVLAVFERSMSYVWQRHMVSAIGRWLSVEDDADEQAVAFVDLTAFSKFTKNAKPEELTEVIETFERVAFDTIAGAEGRVVKLIGDEVMFVTPTTIQAVQICLDIMDALQMNELMPELHCGVAFGPTVTVGGDVFGTTVNLASRLTDVARPGTVVLPKESSEAVTARPGMTVKRVRRSRDLKGFGSVSFVSVRRDEAPAADEAEPVAPEETNT